MISLQLAVCAAALAQPSDASRSLGEPWFELIPGFWEFAPRSTEPRGVSADGTVVYGSSHGPNGSEAMTWTRDRGTVAHGGVLFFDSSDDGTRFAGNQQGLYIMDQGWIDLGAPAGADGSMFAYGISGDGLTVVGMAEFNNDGYPAIWTEADGAQVIILPPEIEPRGWAVSVSYDGSTILGNGYVQGQSGEAWLKQPDAAFYLHEQARIAQALSTDGQVAIGGGENSPWFYRDPIGFQQIFLNPPCSSGEPRAIDATGGYIVGGDERNCAYIYDRFNGSRDLQTLMEQEFGLDLGDFTITSASGISADGRVIVGMGQYQGGRQGWVAYLPLLRCPADFNGDDALDFFDVLEYLAAFANGDPEADLLEDGILNFFDIATFLDRFSMGCV
jgi:uncharacterized membrane protein